jgi:citrate lyase subunit beta/citryl-CoA lyase
MSPSSVRMRSVLFAPAVRPDFLERLPERGADVVVFDCEDATPPQSKEDARTNVRALAPGLAVRGARVFVRINAPATGWFEGDIAHGLCPEVEGILVPKLDRIEDIDRVEDLLSVAGRDDLLVVAGIETALGVADARSLLAHRRVGAAYFGAEDYIGDLGGLRTPENKEVEFARASLLLAARLAGVPALDQAVVDFRNAERFEREVREARALGYAGKLCIHPGQVALANAGFSPSGQECARARRLIAAFEKAVESGVAALEFEGQMIDEPVVAQARRILAAAQEGT